MKRQTKDCKHGTDCIHTDKCSYKHNKSSEKSKEFHGNRFEALERSVKELKDGKIKYDIKLVNLETGDRRKVSLIIL